MPRQRRRAARQEGCLTLLARLLRGSTPTPPMTAPPVPQQSDWTPVIGPLPYRPRGSLLTPVERMFFSTLRQCVPPMLIIAMKVRLSDLVESTLGGRDYRTNNPINQKHVDFVLCDAQTLEPRLVLELDDSSHGRSDRQARDAWVDAVFQAAGLRIVHVPVSYASDVAALQVTLATMFGVSPAPVPPQFAPGAPPPLHSAAPTPVIAHASQPIQPAPVSAATPPCPVCGHTMVLRQVRSGPKQGQQFYGCTQYPHCRGMRAL